MSRQRTISLQAKCFPLCGIGFHAMRVGHVGGELEFAAEGIDGGFDEGAEVLEEGAGGLLGLGLGPVGLVVGVGLGGDGDDFGLNDAFEDDFGRGAGELVAGVFGDADELAGDGVAEVLADAEGGALGVVAGEGAAGTFEDGIEGGEEFFAGVALLLGAGAFASAGGGDLGLQGLGLVEQGAEAGLIGGRPITFGELGGDVRLRGFQVACVGEVDGIDEALADESGFGAFGFAVGGLWGGWCGCVWHGGGWVGMENQTLKRSKSLLLCLSAPLR